MFPVKHRLGRTDRGQRGRGVLARRGIAARAAGRAQDEAGRAGRPGAADQPPPGDDRVRRGRSRAAGPAPESAVGRCRSFRGRLLAHPAQPIFTFLEMVVWSMSDVRTVTATFQSPAHRDLYAARGPVPLGEAVGGDRQRADVLGLQREGELHLGDVQRASVGPVDPEVHAVRAGSARARCPGAPSPCRSGRRCRRADSDSPGRRSRARPPPWCCRRAASSSVRPGSVDVRIVVTTSSTTAIAVSTITERRSPERSGSASRARFSLVAVRAARWRESWAARSASTVPPGAASRLHPPCLRGQRCQRCQPCR